MGDLCGRSFNRVEEIQMDHHEIRSDHVNIAFSRSLAIMENIEGNS